MIDFKALLNEEKNLGKNPAALYKTEAFQNLDSQLEALSPEEKSDTRSQALEALEEHKDSIILPYIAGRLLLMLRPHEYNMRLNNILLSFYEARNWDVVKYIGNVILSVSESSKALRVLGDVAGQQGDEDLKWNYYERLVRTDSQDHDIIVEVADHYESIGDKKNAMNCYQRALNRLMKSGEYENLEKIFAKLLANGKSDFPFYSSFLETLSESSKETALKLYKELHGYMMNIKRTSDKDSTEYARNLDNLIEVTRRIFMIDRSDDSIREDLLDVLKGKYHASPRLGECLRRYNFAKSDNPVKSLDDFEKDISFAPGTYVFQKALNRVGLIIDVKGGKVSVRYSASDVQNIDLDAAFNSLNPLTKQNLKAIRKGVPAEKIKAKIMGNGGIEWLVRTLLYSAPEHQSGLKDMKAEIVPSILKESEWKSILDKIKTELRTNSHVLILSSGRTDVYRLTAYPVTPEEKTLYAFRNQQIFTEKISILSDALENQSLDISSDAILEMVSFFEQTLDNEKRPMQNRIASALFLDWLSEKGAAVSFDTSVDTLIQMMSDSEIKEVFNYLPVFLKKEFVNHAAETKRAADLLILVFPSYISSYIPSKLKKINKGADFIAYARKCLESYRDNVPAFVFFATQYQFSPTDIRKIGIDWNRIIKSELTALSTIRDDGSKAKLRKDLLDDGKIFSFIKTADEDDVESIIPLVLANEGLDSSEKDRIKARIKERLPQVQFDSPKPQVQTVKAPEIKAASGFLCTEESYNRKTEELKDINTNQIPEILKEINFARELGDLRENSEYQYAKEHKRELERRIGELNNDLSTVRIMHPEDVVDGLIGFGTEVKLHDNLEDKDITYTFMGRWESKPEEGIIDINAPLGKMLINHRTGDNIVFDINDRKFDFTVLSISKVEF